MSTPAPDGLQRQIDFYVRKADHYDRSFWSMGDRENRNHFKKIQAISDALGITASSTGSVLEVGTGTGLHARWFLERTKMSYRGLDVSVPMLEIARQRVTEWTDRAQLTVGDAQLLPFPDGAFDAAFCAATLHHLQDPSKGVSEVARVVRPGGRVALMEPNWKYPTVLVYSASVREEWNTFKINPRRLREWASAAGVTDIAMTPVLYTPPQPKSFTRFFEWVDRTMPSVPVLRALSITMLLSGRKI